MRKSRTSFIEHRDRNEFYSSIASFASKYIGVVPIMAGIATNSSASVTFPTAVATAAILHKPLNYLSCAFNRKAWAVDTTVAENVNLFIKNNEVTFKKWLKNDFAFAAALSAMAVPAGMIVDTESKRASQLVQDYLDKKQAALMALPELKANDKNITNKDHYCDPADKGYKSVEVSGRMMKLNCGG